MRLLLPTVPVLTCVGFLLGTPVAAQESTFSSTKRRSGCSTTSSRERSPRTT